MSVEVVVPEVGEIETEVTFVRWLKGEGEHVREGEPLFEVDTVKSTLEIAAHSSGVLADRRVDEGDRIDPRQVIALLVQPGESLETTGQPDPGPTQPHSASRESANTDKPGGAQAYRLEVPSVAASPRARRRAREVGVDLARVAGSGPHGLITVADVERATSRRPSPDRPDSDGAGRRVRTRKAVALITQNNWRTIPHIQLSVDVDVTAALSITKPSVAVLVALTRALEQQPECNLAWRGDDLVPRDGIDLGLLVDTPHGLLLPAIRGAERLDLDGMAAAVQEAVGRARAGALRGDDAGERSATVSNLGMFAVDRFEGVIAAPDVLLLSVGRVRALPRWDGDRLVARKICTVTLAVDHRALDGADGGRLLTRLEDALASPEVLQ